jgi:hypothetical protein
VFMATIERVSVGQAWCILRTSGRSTLKLAETLTTDGLDAWSPRETVKIRVPRKNVRREITVPIMPGYVFAKSEFLLDLLEMERMEVKPRRGPGFGKPAHVRFSVMRHGGQLVVIEDRHLQSLRALEQHAELARIRMKKAEPFPIGVTVRVKEGMHNAWGGMVGRVMRSAEKDTLIQFHGGRIEVKIRTSLLSLDEICVANYAAA